jgi:hypothetical protein
METTKLIDDEIPPMKKGQLNVYKPSDIKRWGVERFLEVVASKEPFHFNIEFSEEENRRMDEILAEEKGR